MAPNEEGGSLTGLTVALNETVVESIPPFKTPPSSLTVILITDVPNLFSIGINASCSGAVSYTHLTLPTILLV